MRRLLTVMLGLSLAMLGSDRLMAAPGLRTIILLDNSGSMNGRMPGGQSRIDAAKRSILTVLSNIPDDAEVGVLVLNPVGGSQWIIEPGPVDKDLIRNAVNRVSANGPTPLGQSLQVSANALLDVRSKQKYGTYKLLVVTDGEATDQHMVQQMLPELQARGLLLDVIGVAMRGEHSLAQSASTYRSASDPASLEKAIAEVVLGESGGASDNDSAEADFELLAPIPNELASASLAALTSPANSPIGQQPQGAGSPANPVNPPVANNPRPAMPQGQQVPPPAGNNNGGGISFGTLVFGAIILLFVAQMFSSIGKSR